MKLERINNIKEKAKIRKVSLNQNERRKKGRAFQNMKNITIKFAFILKNCILNLRSLIVMYQNCFL